MLMLIGLFVATVVLLTLAAFYKSDMDKKLEKFPQPISRYLLLGHAHLGILYLVSCISKFFAVLHDLAFERRSQPARHLV